MKDDNRVYINESPGMYAIRLARKAVEVACLVTYEPTRDPETGAPLDRSFFWTIVVEGDQRYYQAPSVCPHLMLGRPISGEEYAYLVERGAWARRYRPQSPEAQTRKPVDLQTVHNFF